MNRNNNSAYQSNDNSSSSSKFTKIKENSLKRLAKNYIFPSIGLRNNYNAHNEMKTLINKVLEILASSDRNDFFENKEKGRELAKLLVQMYQKYQNIRSSLVNGKKSQFMTGFYDELLTWGFYGLLAKNVSRISGQAVGKGLVATPGAIGKGLIATPGAIGKGLVAAPGAVVYGTGKTKNVIMYGAGKLRNSVRKIHPMITRSNHIKK